MKIRLFDLLSKLNDALITIAKENGDITYTGSAEDTPFICWKDAEVASIELGDLYDILITVAQPSNVEVVDIYSTADMARKERQLKDAGYKKVADCMWSKIYRLNHTEIVLNREF